MINKIILTGRLVRDPELKKTNDGVSFSKFTIAVDRNYRNSEGEVDTDFIDIISWRKQAERCVEYLSKGRLIGIEGSLQISKNESEDRIYVNSIVNADRIEYLDSPKN